jgi:hypothetical protein
VESAAVFALIMLYIWWLRYQWPLAWAAILAVVCAFQVVHGETSASLGLRTTNLRRALARYMPWLLLAWLALLIAGVWLGVQRRVSFAYATSSLLLYCIWGLFQQYVLNGYFTSRFRSLAPRRAPWLAAAAFSLAHTPNWFLMLVALPGGYAAAKNFLHYRNLYFLGVAHGLVGWLIWLLVPDSISGHMRVGPGWFGEN